MQNALEILKLAGSVGKLALNALLPPRCLACGAIVGDDGGLCAVCWSSIAFIAEPVCDCCGAPSPYAAPFDSAEEALCAECVARRPLYARARAALVYDDASKSLLLGFKHADRLHAAAAFAAWMSRAGGDLLRDADVLVPIPLHGRRLFLRRYNQAAVLALALRRLTGKPAAVNALERRRATPPQGRLGREARRRNVAGAFAATSPGRRAVAGRRVLLVDDVLTTGATAEACAKVLLAAGAAAVDVLTLAKAPRGR